jgi:UDP-N-acetylglucosamine acyltransferase
LKRAGFSKEDIHTIQDVYRFVFGNGLNTTQAVQKIQEEIPASQIRDTILDFIKTAERGIIKGID